MRWIALCLTLLATPLWAECTDPSLFSELPQAEQDALITAVDADPYGRGLVWQATRGAQTITVVGTMHIPHYRLSGLFDQVLPLLEASDQLLLEATTAEQAQFEGLLAADRELVFLPPGPSLADLIGPEYWAKVEVELEALGMPTFFAAQFKPWFLGLSLAIPPCAIASIRTGEKGLDGQLEAAATAQGMPISSLDDLQNLLQLLAGDPLEKQIEEFKLAIDSGMLGTAAIGTMLDLYFQEEPQLIWDYNMSQALSQAGSNRASIEASLAEFEKGLLTDRNIAWMPRILAAAEEAPSTMVAVGAAHLPGDSGILKGLAEAGFTLTRVRLNPL